MIASDHWTGRVFGSVLAAVGAVEPSPGPPPGTDGCGCRGHRRRDTPHRHLIVVVSVGVICALITWTGTQ